MSKAPGFRFAQPQPPFVLSLLLGLLLTTPALAQAALAREAATELVQAIARQGGKQAAEELAQLGGEAAVRQLLEKAGREGGEALVTKVIRYGRTEGVIALRVLDRAPARFVAALDELGPELVRPALWAAQREPELITKLVTAYGKGALEMAARHPGVGPRLVERFGAQGIAVGAKLSTEEVTLFLARHADDVARLAPAEQSKVLQALGAAPKAVLDYLERHPKVLLTAGGVAALVAVQDNLLGPSGQRTIHPDGTVTEPAPGLIGRMFDSTIGRLDQPMRLGMGAIMAILAAGLAAWVGIQLWGAWRKKQAVVRTDQRKH